MDKMNINLKSNLTRKLVSKIITKMVYKKYGCKIDMQLNGFEFSDINGEMTIKTNVEVKGNSREIKELLRTMSDRD